jgi:uncharacterized protein (TIGR03086 family)
VEELVGRHRGACAGFARVADAVAADDWSNPTPCTEWDARGVVEHVIGFHEFLLLRPFGVRADRPREGPAARWRATADAFFGLLDADGALDRASDLPGGGESTPRTMLAALTDVLVHTWDLAVATGLDPALNADLCERALTALGSHDPGGPDQLVKAAITVAADASPADRLVARYGRSPAWSAPA